MLPPDGGRRAVGGGRVADAAGAADPRVSSRPHGVVRVGAARNVPLGTRDAEGAVLPPLRRRLPRLVRLPATGGAGVLAHLAALDVQDDAE